MNSKESKEEARANWFSLFILCAIIILLSLSFLIINLKELSLFILPGPQQPTGWILAIISVVIILIIFTIGRRIILSNDNKVDKMRLFILLILVCILFIVIIFLGQALLGLFTLPVNTVLLKL